jgi:predicted outer membrane repeat protein
MKKIKMVFSILLLSIVSTVYAIDLSLNQSEFSAGDPLTLTLTNEDWAGEADIYVALTLPGDETFYFLTSSGLVLESLPFLQAQIAAGSREILHIASLVSSPPGEYTFYVGVTVPGTLETIGDTAMISMNFVAGKLDVSNISFPDGAVGRSYSFAIEPNSGVPPYQFSLTSGSLPVGLRLNSGLIQGMPSEKGSVELVVQVTDARGDVAEIETVLNVFKVLSFGEQGCDGLQEAFDASEDLDEIRIEQGTYECHGLVIPEGKNWEHGIKVSGGWDSSFENQSGVTVFDAKEQGRILAVYSGTVTIEGLSFQNGNAEGNDGGAIYARSAIVNISNCSFSGNSAGEDGGAVHLHSGNITNSSFSGNSATWGGAAFYLYSGNITNSSFSGNSATWGGAAFYLFYGNITNSSFSGNSATWGGAVYGPDNIINSSFNGNSANYRGGAVYGFGNIINSTLSKNGASDSGGAFYGSGIILNSIFVQNQAGGKANDIAILDKAELYVDYTLANNISEGVDLGSHIITGDPRFVDAENGDFRLRADSPAIDVGDSSVIESYPFLRDEAGNVIDLDGNRRVVGEGIDLGAYEYE